MDKIQEIQKAMECDEWMTEEEHERLSYLLNELNRVKEDRASWRRVAERLQSEADAAKEETDKRLKRATDALSDIAFGRVEGDYSDVRQYAREVLEEVDGCDGENETLPAWIEDYYIVLQQCRELKRENERLLKALDHVRFYCAGTDFDHVSKWILKTVHGEGDNNALS